MAYCGPEDVKATCSPRENSSMYSIVPSRRYADIYLYFRCSGLFKSVRLDHIVSERIQRRFASALQYVSPNCIAVALTRKL
jgi:hypothetical protein